MDGYWVEVFWSLLPTVVVSGLFFFILRSILRADRTERRVYARIEARERAKRGLPPVTAPREPPPVGGDHAVSLRKEAAISVAAPDVGLVDHSEADNLTASTILKSRR